MNRNVLTWLTEQVPEARHALVLTHNISFLFTQSVLLSKLRSAGNPRLTIFADAGCAGSAWRQDQDLVSGLGIQYRVVPVDLGPWRRFHPKALLLADGTRAALAIGSGNLTQGGMGSNREAWVFGSSDDGGGARIAAFRSYIANLIDTLPLSAPLRDTIDAVFDPDYAWVSALPTANGVAVAPSGQPILDQLADAAGEVRAVTVLAPYYDDRGEALGEIASRFKAPVTALLQPGRVGLWAGAAKGLPTGVTLKSVQVPGERPPFIHAKVLALHRADDVLLAVGSANCSRAALLSGGGEGNAELMAWEIVPSTVAETLLAELTITDEVPELPPEPLSDDWADGEPARLRILAARQEAGELEIAFTPDRSISELVISAEGFWPVQELDAARGVARVSIPLRLRTVRLRATIADGTVVESLPAWVDDEASLSASATLRRIFKRLADAEEPSTNPARGYQAVLEIFHEYLNDPEASRRRIRLRDNNGPPTPYDPAAVFDDSFGMAGLPAARGTVRDKHRPTSALALIEALFNVGPGVGSNQPGTNDEHRDQDGDDPPEAEVFDVEVHAEQREPDPRSTAAVRRAVLRIEQTLLDPTFVQARAPALLSTDLGLAAILLVMGLTQGHLEVDDFRAATRRLWSGLFFGQGTQPGTIPGRLSAQEDKAAFLHEFTSPRLAAALTLWCVTEWSATDDDALWFRLSAARLQANWPFLFAAGDPGLMANELEAMGTALLPPNEQAHCAKTWREVVRAGMALEMLSESLAHGPREVFRKVSAGSWLEPSDLVWAGKSLAFPVARTRHDAAANVAVRPLGAAKEAKFKGGFIFPVGKLLESGILDIPPAAHSEIRRLVGDLESGEPVMRN
jgi:hypothetical protein